MEAVPELHAGDVGRGRAGRDSRELLHAARIGDWMRLGELLANDGVFQGNQLTPPRYVTMMLKPTTRTPSMDSSRVRTANSRRTMSRGSKGRTQRLWLVPSLEARDPAHRR